MKVKVNVAYDTNLPGDVVDEGGENLLLDLLNRGVVTKVHADAVLSKVPRPVSPAETKPANAGKADAKSKEK